MIGLACTRFKSATVAGLEEWQWILLAAYLEVNIVVITEKSENSYPRLTNFESKIRIQQIKKPTQWVEVKNESPSEKKKRQRV